MVQDNCGDGSGQTVSTGLGVGAGAGSGKSNCCGESEIDLSDSSNRWNIGWGTGTRYGNCDFSGLSSHWIRKIEHFRPYG